MITIYACYLACAWRTIASTTPELMICLRNLSEITHFEPNWEGFVVNVSFVWESNAGFSMLELTNIQSYCFIWKFLIFSFSFLCFFFTSAMILLQIRSVTELTWVPPRIVQMELTKETCWNCPSEKLTMSFHLLFSLLFSTIFTGFSP